MTPRTRLPTAVALAALVALGGCSTSAPPTRLHSLMPAEPTPREPATAARAPLFVALEPIRLPAQVDQPQWLVRLPDESLAILEQERWASPLQDELRQALLEELGARYGLVESAAGAGAPWRVRLELRRFDSVPGREARIEGSWLLGRADPGRPSLRCDWRYAEAAGAGMPSLASAHRRAVVRLADALGEALLKLGRGEAAACPARGDSP